MIRRGFVAGWLNAGHVAANNRQPQRILFTFEVFMILINK
jgi:hypothetical protein